MLKTDGVWNRRHFLQQVGLGVALASTLNSAEAPKLIDNPKGGFRFRKGGNKFSSGGTVAMSGYEIVHVTFATLPPLGKGFEMIDSFLKKQHCPPHALCGVELRSPRPFTFAEFEGVNQDYMEQIAKRDLMVEGVMPVARVNVAPELDPPSELSIYGFSYTAAQETSRPNFLAAAGELSGAYPQGIVARGDVSLNGLREKVLKELGSLDQTLKELGVEWDAVTDMVIYTVHDLHPLVRGVLLLRVGAAKNFGLRWYYARPPLQELEVEMQVRGCARELVI